MKRLIFFCLKVDALDMEFRFSFYKTTKDWGADFLPLFKSVKQNDGISHWELQTIQEGKPTLLDWLSFHLDSKAQANSEPLGLDSSLIFLECSQSSCVRNFFSSQTRRNTWTVLWYLSDRYGKSSCPWSCNTKECQQSHCRQLACSTSQSADEGMPLY